MEITKGLFRNTIRQHNLFLCTIWQAIIASCQGLMKMKERSLWSPAKLNFSLMWIKCKEIPSLQLTPCVYFYLYTHTHTHIYVCVCVCEIMLTAHHFVGSSSPFRDSTCTCEKATSPESSQTHLKARVHSIMSLWFVHIKEHVWTVENIPNNHTSSYQIWVYTCVKLSKCVTLKVNRGRCYTT